MPNATYSRSTQARSGVFISYARSDGEEFANLLRERLEGENIPTWQDRVRMEGGRDWWLQITEALDQVEFMALVMTPSAMKSETVRKEWRYARQQGVCVYPIKGVPDLDFASLPRWMRSAHFYDLEREWQKFLNDLSTRCQIKRVPFMVGDLPEGFVQRPDEFERLLKLLCDERREEPIAITAALRGAGGYGKTTLARALCHDERIQDAFDDGILWVTLGENPGDLTGRVEDLIVTLGDERPGFTTLDAAVNRLKELLADRDILLVIDDVWDRGHLNPFIQSGPRCARLITTRNLDTLPASAQKIKVDAMQQNEASALLVAGLDRAGDEALLGELIALASRLGEWPLLLRLVNSALRNRIENDKQSPRDAVTWINKALDRRGLAFFDARNSDERSQAVAKTIRVSLDLLSEQERERYGELATFPEDVEIPLATVEKLWAKTGGLDDFATEELCSLLNRFSLLWNYDANRRRIRLHDVIRKFLIEQQPEKLPSIHAQLLDSHGPPHRWSEMPAEEPYLWDHLAHHLVDAGRGDELVTTVKDWRYLVAKTLIRMSVAVESDLLAAENTARSDDTLRLLRRNFVKAGHLLNRCEQRDDIAMTLFSRLQHLNELKSLITDLEQHLKRPYIVPSADLPDLPHPALVRTLSGHREWVSDCAVSADGSTIVSASRDKTLKVWDGWTGAERFTLSGHMDWVRGCATSADGATIVSASDDKTLKVWDGLTGTERLTLTGHSDWVRSCAISADGATIVSGANENTLKVWDGQTGAERLTLGGHVGAVHSCAVTADGMIIVSASGDRTLKVWDGRSGVERFTLSGHTGEVYGCAVSDEGAVIVSASQDNTLKVWDGRSGAERFTLRGHTGCVNACALTADGMTIVSASEDQTLKVWDGWTGAGRITLVGTRAQSCGVTRDGETIVSAADDVKVWDGAIASYQVPLSVRLRGAKGCAMSADGSTVASASDDQTLKVWDGRTGTERFTVSAQTYWVKSCAVSADGLIVVSTSDDTTLKVWDGQSGAEQVTLRGHTGWVSACAISADGSIIVSACDDHTLKVWDARTGAERFTLSGHEFVLTACAVTADGAMIVSTSDDDAVRVWDGRSGIERLTLRGHQGKLKDCAVSADGETIVSASSDQTLKVWDGQTGAERFTLKGHRNWVNSCAVSSDGKTIISASEDQTVKVWNETGECSATLHVDGPLYGCACTADGEIIAAVGSCGIYFLRLVR